MDGPDDAVDCVTKPYIGVVYTEAPKQVLISFSWFMLIPPWFLLPMLRYTQRRGLTREIGRQN